jgi:pimeloyl-ACP methyl ester carboxylesterase
VSFRWDDRKGMIEIDGKRLEWASFGPPPATRWTIVLLHEGLGSVALWREFPERLAQSTGFGVFAYSRAGYGWSDPAELPRPLDYMTREARDVLPKVLDLIGFNRGVLIGHSDGATIAAIYAGSAQDFRVRGLVLMAPHFFTEPMGLKEIRDARETFETTDMKARMAKYHADPEATFRGWNDAWLDPDFAKWNVADAIDYLRVPVLAIQGRQDQYGTEAQIEEIEKRIYSPHDVEWLEDCGHSPHLEQPERTLSAIADYVRRLERIENVNVEIG